MASTRSLPDDGVTRTLKSFVDVGIFSVYLDMARRAPPQHPKYSYVPYLPYAAINQEDGESRGSLVGPMT